MTALEDRVIEELKEGSCSVERALLAVSGLETEEAIAAHIQKIDLIQEDFESRYCEQLSLEHPKEFQTAELLFDYFWETKPNRYNGDFLLAKVIDNQLDEDKNKRVGSCVGLTSLYSVLGLRLGLELSVLVKEVNDDHVLTLLSCNNKEIVVENTDRFGFNSELESRYKTEDLILLVSSVLFKKGYVKSSLGDLNGALLDYNRAIELEPDYADAFNNRGNTKSDLGDFHGALLDYNRAIELRPDYATAFNNRGDVKSELGDLNGALLDYNRAIELKPDYATAFNNRGCVKEVLSDLNGALLDYNRAIELEPDNIFAKQNKKYLLRKLKREQQIEAGAEVRK